MLAASGATRLERDHLRSSQSFCGILSGRLFYRCRFIFISNDSFIDIARCAGL
jgi:hypothetical protein